MAAEYSRELASKCRAGQHVVIMRGFQIGALPPMGYRRCSVSADGQRRMVLGKGQRKLTVTDRIEWVLAPQPEVEIVRRICQLYAVNGLSFTDIARLGRAEGWRAHDGGQITNRSIATLVRNEALIGNFAWGRRKSRKNIVACSPSRLEDCVPRIIDDATWARMQSRIAFEIEKRHIEGELAEKLRNALGKNPLLTMRDLRAHGLAGRHALRSRLGPWGACLERAGCSLAAHQGALLERARQHRDHAREFGHAIAQALREAGHRVSFGGSHCVLAFAEFKVRVRLLWPTVGEAGRAWRLWMGGASRDVDFALLVRMECRFRAVDFFLVPTADFAARFPRELDEHTPHRLARFWCGSPSDLLERIKAISTRLAGARHCCLNSSATLVRTPHFAFNPRLDALGDRPP